MSLDALYSQLIQGPSPARAADPLRRPASSTDFASELDKLLATPEATAPTTASAPVHFSKHAKARLQSRGIELQDSDLERISKAVDQLELKGAKESLVLLDETALIVGVPKRTVITAMSRDEALGNLFTGIDSAVLAA
ncbi:MAG: flagellar operon protein [Cognaticolwellia sp.]